LNHPLADSVDFEDLGGPGCGVADHDCDCLCDVPTGAELAAAVTDCEGQKLDAAFVAEARQEIGVDVVTSFVDLELIADFVLARANGKGQYAGNAEGVKLLRSGMSFKDIANECGMRLRDVVELFTQIPPAGLEPLLEVERLLRAGAASFAAVGKATGLNPDQVRFLAENMGVMSAAAAACRNGRGPNAKYTAEQIEQCWRYKHQGKSLRETAALLGFDDGQKGINTVHGILKRNACPYDVDVPNVTETVAA
jgi:hypothetical protein